MSESNNWEQRLYEHFKLAFERQQRGEYPIEVGLSEMANFISQELDERTAEVIDEIPAGFHEGENGVVYIASIKQQLKDKYGIK